MPVLFVGDCASGGMSTIDQTSEFAAANMLGFLAPLTSDVIARRIWAQL